MILVIWYRMMTLLRHHRELRELYGPAIGVRYLLRQINLGLSLSTRVHSLEELATTRADRHASVQQSTFYANLASIRRMTLGSHKWSHTISSGKGITTQFMGSICKLRTINDWYFGEQLPIPSY